MVTTATETAADREQDGAGITILDPRTGQVLWTVPEAGTADVNHAVDLSLIHIPSPRDTR